MENQFLFFRVGPQTNAAFPALKESGLHFNSDQESEHNNNMEAVDIADAFDRLFMIKEGMSQEEIEESRQKLSMIKFETQMRLYGENQKRMQSMVPSQQQHEKQDSSDDLVTNGKRPNKRRLTSENL